mgnify:CR=1 FL=1
MKGSKWIIWAAVAVVGVVIVVLLSSGGSASGTITNARLLELQAEGARLVDVRTEGEFAAGYSPGAGNIPRGSRRSAAESWDRTQPIILYCAVGDRSAEGIRMLASMGFERVYDLTTGIAQWDGDIAGRPAVADAGDAGATNGLPVLYEFYTDW